MTGNGGGLRAARAGLVNAIDQRAGAMARWFDTVRCMDAFDLLRALPAGSVDLCLTDMPYGVTACEWDQRPDLAAWWDAMRHIMKPRGAVVLTASQPFTSMLVMSHLEWFKYSWVWRKTMPTGYIHAKNMPLRLHEDILVFYPEL